MDEHRVLAAVVDPHPVRLSAQHNAETDFTANLLYVAAIAVVPSSSSVAVVPIKVRRAVAAWVLAAAVVSVGVELAEAEARALR